MKYRWTTAYYEIYSHSLHSSGSVTSVTAFSPSSLAKKLKKIKNYTKRPGINNFLIEKKLLHIDFIID